MNTRKKLRRIFREYWNDYLTIQTMADHNNITRERAYRIINLGRKLHNRRADELNAIIHSVQ